MTTIADPLLVVIIVRSRSRWLGSTRKLEGQDRWTVNKCVRRIIHQKIYKGGIGDAQSSVCCLLHVYVSAGGECMCAPIDKYARQVFFPLSVCVLFAPGWYTTPKMLQELKKKGKKRKAKSHGGTPFVHIKL